MTDAERLFMASRFRASPLFALVAHDELAPDQRAAFGALAGRADYFGLLMPDTALPLSAKTVGPDLAALLRALRQPAQLPVPLRDAASDSLRRALRELVIDGILEIETAQGFVCGPQATAMLFGAAPDDEVRAGVSLHGLQRLSWHALQHAAALPELPPLALASRLYRHHSVPLTPDWEQSWGHLADARELLGLGAGTTLGGLLFEHYIEVDHAAWHMWQRSDRMNTASAAALPVKLYISPHPEALSQATSLAVELLARARVPAFKLVRGGHGLLRPDKLIAYLESLEQLQAVAALLAPALRGCRAQGVPFTCALGDDGLLSWGSDPPDGQRLLEWQRVESWRSWITRRLAFALVQARGSGASPTECCRFALERLRLDHIDIHTWSPTPEVWREEQAP